MCLYVCVRECLCVCVCNVVYYSLLEPSMERFPQQISLLSEDETSRTQNHTTARNKERDGEGGCIHKCTLFVPLQSGHRLLQLVERGGREREKEREREGCGE